MSRHLLHVFPTFEVGGAQMRLAILIGTLGAGYRHTIIAMDGRYDAAALLPPDAKVEFGEHSSEGNLLKRLVRYRLQIKSISPDVLVTYNWGAIEWAMACALTNVRHIHAADGFGPDEAAGQFRRRILTRRVALRRGELIVPSLALKAIATDLWRLNPKRVLYIPNGIAPRDAFQTRIEDLGLDLPADTPRIVWAGALRREKNVVRLLKAFAPLKDQAVLVLIGEGPERGAIEAEAKALGLGSRCHLLGARKDVRDLMMQCDVFALSSDTEQMPIVLLEAMDAGLPAASVDAGDVVQMVAEENQPYVVEKSVEALTEALRGLIADPAARRSIGAANQRRMRGTYDLDRMTARYRDAFDAPGSFAHA